MAALIILNSKYQNTRYKNLRGVKEDGKLLNKMFKDHGIVSKTVEDVSDIEAETEQFCKDNIGKTVLYFCFSGIQQYSNKLDNFLITKFRTRCRQLQN